MRKQLLIFGFLFLSVQTYFGQLNIDSVSHIDYQQLHQTDLNDIWGYVDETGVEYALVGAQKGTSVVSLADPLNPQEVFWEPGMESIWRDLKTWQNYAFVTTEAENGLLIIDLNPLPSSSALTTNYYNGEVGNTWSSAHNLYIDENGYAYIFGMNRGNGGVIILDVHTDPMHPIEVGEFDTWYVHDGFVRNDTMYLAHIDEGFMSIVDVSDKANPVLLGTKTTPSNFTHNIWPSANSQFAFTTDEVSGGYLGAYYVADPSNIYEVDRIQSSPGAGVIPHNVHVLGNYLVTSYYSDGVTIHDITYPHNMIQVGAYDTYATQTTSYDGCWGAYPFLPSGLLLVTDISNGLFILNPTYSPAAYLEGMTTDFGTGLTVAGVNVQIQGHDQVDLSTMGGFYATGIVNGGTYNVLYSKVGYYPQTHSVDLLNGAIVNKDVQLVAIPPFNLTVNVFEEGTGNPISNADIRLTGSLIAHEGETNGIGVEDFVMYYQQEYDVVVGKWGYVTTCYDTLIDENTISISVVLSKGYYDDFEFDFGWISSGNATTGKWERGKPNATSSGSNPGFDADYDCGKKAFVTGNKVTANSDVDDVDGGTAILISPTMDLSTYSDPYINFTRWFYCKHGAPTEDTMKILISNGFSLATIDLTGQDPATELTWVPRSIRLLDHISATSSMQLIVRVPDLDPDVNITEGGFDYFFVSNQNVAEQPAVSDHKLKIFPNPVIDKLVISGLDDQSTFSLSDINGRIIRKGVFDQENSEIDMLNLASGCYLLQIDGQVFRVLKD